MIKMFKKEYTFHGSHAEKVRKLKADFDTSPNSSIFARNVDILLFAPIVGFLYGKKSPVDKTIKVTAKIFTDTMIKEDSGIKFNFQTISLLDKKNKLSKNERIDKAFRGIEKQSSQNDIEVFNEYILGGVDILYDKLIEPSTLPSDYLNNLFDFLDDFNDKYNKEISTDDINDLIVLARQ
jgi:hypothetical protein